MLSWLVGAGSSAISNHVSGRSASWWTGPNSLWGSITGGGGNEAGVTVQTERPGDKDSTPLIIGAFVLYLFLK